METAIVLFTRDLRLHDNPALHLACRQARQVLPLFVADPAIPAPPNRPGASWHDDHDALEAWRAGRTGIPIVDAGMRQLAAEGFNWQWVAGTGNSTRPNRVMNPLRQAQRFDPAGEYVRRYVPELAGLDPQYLQTPWKSKAGHLGYPDPIVELG